MKYGWECWSGGMAILILEGREGWEWVRFLGRMGGKEGHPKKMEGTQVWYYDVFLFVSRAVVHVLTLDTIRQAVYQFINLTTVFWGQFSKKSTYRGKV